VGNLTVENQQNIEWCTSVRPKTMTDICAVALKKTLTGDFLNGFFVSRPWLPDFS
jgi:hypothetical protein